MKQQKGNAAQIVFLVGGFKLPSDKTRVGE